MKIKHQFLSLLLLICFFPAFGQVTESQIRQKINLNVPTNGTKQISAVKLREVLNKMTDYAAKTDSLALTRQAALGFTPENLANKVSSLNSPSSLTFPNTQAVATALGVKADTATVSMVANTRTPYATSTALRAGSVGTPDAVILTDKLGYTFRYDATDTTTPDDSAMVIRIGSRRYKRAYDGPVRPEWFGAIPNDLIDDSPAFQKAANFGSKDILVSPGTWLVHGVDLKNSDLIGSSSGNTFIKCNGGTEIFTLGYDDPHWRRKLIENVTLDGNGRAYNGVRFYLSVEGQTSGRWNFHNVVFRDFDKAVYKPNGNIGNVFEYCLFKTSNYTFFAVGTLDPYMHAGFDTFDDCTWESNLKACIYIDSDVGGTGGTVFNRPHFESNPGFLVFIKNYTQNVFTPIQFDQFWSEINATADSVNIEGTWYEPKDVYIRNCGNFVFTRGAIGGVDVINSTGSFDNMLFTFNGYTHTADSASVVNVTNIVGDAIKMPFLTHSIQKLHRPMNATSGVVLNAPHRLKLAKNKPTLFQEDFQTAVTLGGSLGITGTVIAGGPTLDSCNRFTMTPGQTNIGANATITNGKYYVATFAIRQVSAQSIMYMQLGNGTVISNHQQRLLKQGKWKTLATVGKAEATGTVALYLSSAGAGGNAVFDLQAFQIVEFNTEAEAYEFYRQAIY